YGSVYVFNEARAVWRLDAVEDGPSVTVTFTHTKANRGPKHRPLAMRLTFTEDSLAIAGADPLAQPTATRDPITVDARLRAMLTTGALTVDELVEATGKTEWAIRKALGRMADAFPLPDTTPKRWALRARDDRA